ncbi:hypothetical protein MIND_00982200 [Mycena indigotica]|uniref:Uncharacterized protein n=1 Tax=Mycena indigotica TaxID=2126181 RepID=A0A8H6SDL9_9AGAR|nr:uncharacterized protein MIND_00982200 [Mycena indigotica]KAF7297484.1 hypothetical protein MIND_00982200 [Mycena indigotica]
MPLQNVSVPFANLLGLTLGGMIYGAYLILFLSSIYLFVNGYTEYGPRASLSRRFAKALRSPIVIASIALFLTSTITWVMTVYRNFRGWIFFEGGAAPNVFFNTNADISETVQDVFLALSLTIGDSMIIYRLWVVWRNPYIIALPVLCVLGLFISLIITIVETTRLSLIALDTWITPTTVFILVTNVYCTACIGYKIFAVAVATTGHVGNRKLTHFLAIFVESAAGYTSWALLYTILHQLDRNLQFAIQNTLPAMLGAANALINARVALGRAIELRDGAYTTSGAGSASAKGGIPLSIRFGRQVQVSDPAGTAGTRNMTVKTHTVVGEGTVREDDGSVSKPEAF